MKTRQELEFEITTAKAVLARAEKELFDFDSLAENNVFDSLDEANYAIESKLLGQASEDCEGSYNCGADEYEQEFIVHGVKYIGKLTCEYNRHDKTYYYIDSSYYTFSTAT